MLAINTYVECWRVCQIHRCNKCKFVNTCKYFKKVFWVLLAVLNNDSFVMSMFTPIREHSVFKVDMCYLTFIGDPAGDFRSHCDEIKLERKWQQKMHFIVPCTFVFSQVFGGTGEGGTAQWDRLQGYQIFGTRYQNRKNTLNNHKIYQMDKNSWNCH
jgi:hypothetical protein